MRATGTTTTFARPARDLVLRRGGRGAAALGCLLSLAGTSFAESSPTPQQTEQYRQQSKSVGLAVTLEAVCPLAGAGALYAGQTDKALVLGILSVVTIGAAVGSTLELVHLSHESSGGGGGVIVDAERSGAGLVLVGAVVSYVVLRISGLALAPEAVGAFNADVRNQLGMPPLEPLVPFHALASGFSVSLPF